MPFTDEEDDEPRSKKKWIALAVLLLFALLLYFLLKSPSDYEIRDGHKLYKSDPATDVSHPLGTPDSPPPEPNPRDLLASPSARMPVLAENEYHPLLGKDGRALRPPVLYKPDGTVFTPPPPGSPELPLPVGPDGVPIPPRQTGPQSTPPPLPKGAPASSPTLPKNPRPAPR